MPLVNQQFPHFYQHSMQLGQLNLDGYLVHNATGEHRASNYIQLYGNGIIEALDTALLNFRQRADEPPALLGMPIERTLIQATERYLRLFEQLDVPAPIVALVTLIGVRGWTIRTAGPYDLIRNRYFDRDLVQLPDVMIDDLGTSPGRALRPAIDTMWQAAGFVGSGNYDGGGEWRNPEG